MKDLKNIEDLFKETFNDFESIPPTSVKAAVDGAIKKKKGGLWWLPVLALLLAALPLAYYYTSDSNIAREKSNTLSISGNYSSNRNEKNAETSASFETSTTKHIATHKEDKQKGAYAPANSGENKAKKSHDTPDKQTFNAKKTKTKTTKPQVVVVPKKKQAAKNKKTPITAINPSPQKTTGMGNDQSTEDDNKTKGVNLTEKPGNIKDTLPDEKLASNPVKKDSTTTPVIAKLPDSTKEPSVSPPDKTPSANNSAKNWTASLYFGQQYERAQSSDKAYSVLDPQPAFKFSGEINRTLFSGYGVSTGLGYYKVNDKYETFTYENDSTVTSVDTIPIYDQNDSIIGYDYVFHYDDSTQINHPFNYSISNIIIPVYLSKQFDLGNNWGMLVNAGAVFRMSKVTGGPVAPYGKDPVIVRNSFMISGRAHATYKWDNWMFSLGFNAGYYVKPPVQYHNIKTTRSFITPEIGVHFNF